MNSVECFPTSKEEGKTREEREKKQLRIIHERVVFMLEISRD